MYVVLYSTPTEENFCLLHLFHLVRGRLRYTERWAQVSCPPCPLGRWSAFLLDLSLHLKNLKLIFPSWAKVEEGQCFIKEFFIPSEQHLLYLYTKKICLFVLEKMFSESILWTFNSIVPNSKKKEKERKEKMTTALPQSQQRMKMCFDQLSGTVGTNETPPKCKTQAPWRLVMPERELMTAKTHKQTNKTTY